ncbi:hypothetical protein I7I48_02966 [Histoplasma ohiense]|nr:hypothetical protein I7I48_02966 [Histoplasma ohiense (nom. inval.)]
MFMGIYTDSSTQLLLFLVSSNHVLDMSSPMPGACSIAIINSTSTRKTRLKPTSLKFWRRVTVSTARVPAHGLPESGHIKFNISLAESDRFIVEESTRCE